VGTEATPRALPTSSGQPAYGAPQVAAPAATVNPTDDDSGGDADGLSAGHCWPAGTRNAASSPPLSMAQPANRQVEDLIREFPSRERLCIRTCFPKNPNPQLTNPLREEEGCRPSLKRGRLGPRARHAYLRQARR